MDEIIIGLIVILLTIVFFLIYKKSRSKRRDILLAGLCDSGKTVLFSQLIHGKYLQTYTSMKENTADYVVENGADLRIVDVPGHERLRLKYLEMYTSRAKGIVYVIDSTTIKKDIRDVAEYLYKLLCESVQHNIKDILVLCNKQDLNEALSVESIETLLEKEINTVRFTKSKQLDSVYSKGKKIESVGDSEESFSFKSLEIKTEFVPCTAYGEDVDISSLKGWLTVVA